MEKIASVSHDGHNSSRGLHKYIHKQGKTLPITITSARTRIKLPRKRKVVGAPWPVLHLSDWIRCCFQKFGGFFFLAGQTMGSWEKAEAIFRQFWGKHFACNGETVDHPEATVPIYIHGDEGRGLAKRPLLVISFQPLMSWAGPDVVNNQKRLASKVLSPHLVCCLGILSRLGFSIPSFLRRTMRPKTRRSTCSSMRWWQTSTSWRRRA